MNRRVQPGDLVELLPAAEQTVAIDEERQIRFAEGLLKSGTLEVVYEDDVMAVVNKPAGVHSKPYGGPLSLEHALPGLLAPPQEATDALVRPTCVHRLDARVSGLIVVAKTRHAAALPAEAFRERRVSKRYRALLLGRLQPEAPSRGPPYLFPAGLRSRRSRQSRRQTQGAETLQSKAWAADSFDDGRQARLHLSHGRRALPRTGWMPLSTSSRTRGGGTSCAATASSLATPCAATTCTRWMATPSRASVRRASSCSRSRSRCPIHPTTVARCI